MLYIDTVQRKYDKNAIHVLITNQFTIPNLLLCHCNRKRLLILQVSNKLHSRFQYQPLRKISKRISYLLKTSKFNYMDL